jgi:hypothetical protein
MESEFVVAGEAAKEAIWIRNSSRRSREEDRSRFRYPELHRKMKHIN